MPIRFVDGEDITVKNVTVVYSGPPGVGKTTLALTADKPLMLDFNAGIHRAANRQGKKVVPVHDWKDIATINKDDVKGFKTVIVDTVGSALDFLSRDIIKANPKVGRGGVLTLQGYGTLKGRFKMWLENLLSFGVDVVLVAHTAEEQRGEETVERIVAVGASKHEVNQASDLIGRLAADGGARRITFNPTRNFYGKNVGIEDAEVPDPKDAPDYLGKVIQRAKVLINDLADRHKAEYERVAHAKDWIEGLEGTPEAFNDAVKKMLAVDASAVDRALLVDAGVKKGLSFDKTSKTFSGKEPEPAQTAF